MNLTDLSRAVSAGHELDPDQATAVAHALADAAQPADAKAALLEALSVRGETGAEIAGLAAAFRQLARDPGLERWAPAAIDVCGTGGDRSGTFNVSTVVSFVLAAAGVPVIKHGNRSITSKSGSADLLEALGIRLDADKPTLLRSMEALNFVFLFAPAYHPAFKEIGPVRRALAERGVRTVFNLLGPLLNPAHPAFQLMGVFSEAFVPRVAQALDTLGLAAGLAVHCAGSDGRAYDELTVVGRNRVAGFGRLRGLDESLRLDNLGLQPGSPEDLAGGDAVANAALLDRVLAGTAPRGLIDTIVLNAGTALMIAGRAADLNEGVADAREWLLGGAVRAWLGRAREFYQS